MKKISQHGEQSLQQLFDTYLDECRYIRMLRPETIRGYTETFRRFRLLMPTVTTPSQLSRNTVSIFFHTLQVRKRIVGRETEKVGIRSSTVRTYWSKLNSFFEWLRIKGHIESNPLASMKPPEPTYDDKRALEPDEINRLVTAIILYSTNLFMRKRDLAIIHLLLYCGLRRNELLSLQVSDVDMERRIITVRGSTSKSKMTRQIPMNPALHGSLQEYLEERKKRHYTSPSFLVSSTRDQGLTTYGLKCWVKRLHRMSGITFHLHRFRHSFACTLARQNTSAIKIQRLMGHTDLRMTERYVRSLTVDDFREDVDRMYLDNG